MAITAAEVKALREATGAGMMECKKALQEADGDLEAAKDILRRRGQAKSAKREGRATGEGCVAVAVSDDHRAAALLELNCETDFVGRGDGFRALAQQLAEKALATGANSAEALGAEDALSDAVSQLGEALRIGQVVYCNAGEAGVVGAYLHTATHKVGVLVRIDAEGGDPAAVAAVARDLGMQAAAMRPVCVDRDEVPAADLEREKENLRQAQDMANKPPQIQDKIIVGRLDKGFYQQVCLLDQIYARDGDKSVRQYVEAAGKELGAKLTVRAFCRVEVGAE